MTRSLPRSIMILVLACLASFVFVACLAPQRAFADETPGLAAGSENAPVAALGDPSESTTTTPTDTTAATPKKGTLPKLKYRVYVRGKGWAKKWSKAGKTSGTLNKYKKLEGLRASLKGSNLKGTLEFRVLPSDKDWSKWMPASVSANRVAKGKGISDIEMRLTDELAGQFEVLYRTHISGLGWQPWLIGPAEAGAIDELDRIDAIRIKIVRKNPKSAIIKKAVKNGKKIAKARKKFEDRLDRAEDMARNMSSSTDYLITVDLTNHWLCVFEGGKGNWEMTEDWQVSNGRKGHGTPTGSFTVGDKGYSFGHGYTCYYYTQFYSDYFFHSILYREGTHKVKDGRLGRYISQGCVRMPIKRAKWLQRNIPGGTRVRIYK